MNLIQGVMNTAGNKENLELVRELAREIKGTRNIVISTSRGMRSLTISHIIHLAPSI